MLPISHTRICRKYVSVNCGRLIQRFRAGTKPIWNLWNSTGFCSWRFGYLISCVIYRREGSQLKTVQSGLNVHAKINNLNRFSDAHFITDIRLASKTSTNFDNIILIDNFNASFGPCFYSYKGWIKSHQDFFLILKRKIKLIICKTFEMHMCNLH